MHYWLFLRQNLNTYANYGIIVHQIEQVTQQLSVMRSPSLNEGDHLFGAATALFWRCPRSRRDAKGKKLVNGPAMVSQSSGDGRRAFEPAGLAAG